MGTEKEGRKTAEEDRNENTTMVDERREDIRTDTVYRDVCRFFVLSSESELFIELYGLSHYCVHKVLKTY